MAKYNLMVNQQTYAVDVAPEMPLLWVLRDVLHLTGTKYSCGIADCGACTVLINDQPVRSCSFPVSAVNDRLVLTIEGLASAGLHVVQEAWLSEKVSQCGYCQPGQILNAVALLSKTPHPTDAQIDTAMGNVLCRCGTYQRIRNAVHRAAEAAD